MLPILLFCLLCLLGISAKSGRILVSAAALTPLPTVALFIWRSSATLGAPGYGFLAVFLFLAAIRYVRLLVHIIASWTFQPVIPGPIAPFAPADCTVVMATLGGDTPIFRQCIESVLANGVFRILIVTPYQNSTRLQSMVAQYPLATVLGSQRASKRFQQVCGLRCVTTPVTIFIDDDVIWPSTYLWTTLAVFKDRRVGAAGTCQRLFRSATYNVWDFLGAVYLERRNFECSATSHISGFLSTLSGRCQIVRTNILQNDQFMHGYLSEKWFDRVILTNADDDKFVTKWVKKCGWKMRFQYCPEAEMLTLHNSDWRFLQQCVRWYRTIWRSAFTSMFIECSMWKGQAWSCYANMSRVFVPPALITDPGLAYLLYKSCYPENAGLALLCFALWLVFTKTIKIVPHLYRYPQDIKYLPVHFLFGYFHGFIKLYALFTLHKTSWNGRLAADELGQVALDMAYPVGQLPADMATPGVERLRADGGYEFPRVPEKGQDEKRPRSAKRPTYRSADRISTLRSLP